LNTPKKWTETRWLEVIESDVRPRVTLAGLFASEWNTCGLGASDTKSRLRQDSGAGALAAARHPNAYVRTTCALSIRLFNARCVCERRALRWLRIFGMLRTRYSGKNEVFRSIQSRLRSEKIALWHPICSKSILLPIDARTGLRTLRAGVSPACKRAMATIGAVVPWPEGWSAKRCEVLRK